MGRSGSKRRDWFIWRLGMRNRISQECRARNCQETEEFQSICCEEKPDNWELITREESYYCESALDSNSGVTEQSDFLVWCKRIFTILRQQAALERPTFPTNPWLCRVPENALPRFWIAAWCTEYYGYFGKRFLKAYLLEKDHPQLSSKIHRIWHHLLADQDQVLQDILWNMEEEWNKSRTVRQYQPHVSIRALQSWTHPVSHTGGTYPHNGVMDYPIFPISEMHLGKYPDSLEFQSWNVNKYVQNQHTLISRCTRSKRLRLMSIFEPPEVTKLHKVSHTCPIYAYRMMTFRISIQGGTELY